LSAVVWGDGCADPKKQKQIQNIKLPCEDLCELLSGDHQKSQRAAAATRAEFCPIQTH